MFDRTSPDGKRVLYEGEAWQQSRRETATAAIERCESCPTRHYLPWPTGQAHHRFGRGGGKRDDRLWRPMNPSAVNLLERWWIRNLRWVCAIGHEREHKHLEKFRPRELAWCCHRGCVVRL